MTQVTETLEQVEYDTLDGDTAEGEVVDIRRRVNSRRYDEPTEHEIVVEIELPSGRTVNESFDMPETNSDRYRFVRFLRSHGLTLGDADKLIGRRVAVDVTDGFDVEAPPPTLRQRSRAATGSISAEVMGSILTAFMFLLWPITGLRQFPPWHRSTYGYDPDLEDWLMQYALPSLIWFMFVIVGSMVVADLFL